MNTLKQTFFFVLLSLVFANVGLAQSTKEKTKDNSILKKLVFGGNVGGGYSNGWNINLTPSVGYKITNGTVAGVGLNYTYSDFTNNWNGLRTTAKVGGARVFASQLLFQNLYAHAEYEYLDYTLKYRDTDGRIIQELANTAPGFLVGGGYTTSFAKGLGLNFEVLYNVLYRAENSPYSSPLVMRGGLMFGF